MTSRSPKQACRVVFEGTLDADKNGHKQDPSNLGHPLTKWRAAEAIQHDQYQGHMEC